MVVPNGPIRTVVFYLNQRAEVYYLLGQKLPEEEFPKIPKEKVPKNFDYKEAFLPCITKNGIIRTPDELFTRLFPAFKRISILEFERLRKSDISPA